MEFFANFTRSESIDRSGSEYLCDISADYYTCEDCLNARCVDMKNGK